MSLSMFNKFCPSLRARAQLKESVDLQPQNRFENYGDRYVANKDRKDFWTNNWMQEPRNFLCRLQLQHYDPKGSAQFKRGWGM